MILPIDFIWKQLNGPQVTALKQAMYEWCVAQTATPFAYFNNLSIDTANSAHLTFMGALGNICRPYVTSVDLSIFYFTEHPQSNFSHGFSSINDIGIGGRVVELQQTYDTMTHHPLNDTIYRCILKAIGNSEGEIGSLRMLDDLMYELRKTFGNPNDMPDYNFTLETDVLGAKSYGDVDISLDNMGKWAQAESIIIAVRAISDTLYKPEPQIFPSFDDA